MKLKEILSNPVVTVFMWLLMAACMLATFTHAAKAGDAPQMAVVILMFADAIFLFLKYRK